MVGGVQISITTKDICRFKEKIEIGQKILFVIEEKDEGRVTRRRRVKGYITEKYPYHVLVEYKQNGRKNRKSITYVELYMSRGKEKEE